MVHQSRDVHVRLSRRRTHLLAGELTKQHHSIGVNLNLQEDPKLSIKDEKTEEPLQQWRRMARIVRILCAVCIALRKYAMDAGLMDNYMVSVAARKTKLEGSDGEIEELTFNLKDFKICRELTVPRMLVEMMNRPPDFRSHDDIQAISRLMRNLPSFRKYTTEMQLLMSKIVRYMKCGKRRVVLRKGHIGYSVYFIYSGSVSVVLDKDEQSVFVKPETVILRKGACFGEIALVQNTRRSATVVCAEEAEFLVIDKDDFVENGLHLRTQAEFQNRREFLRSWAPIQDWTDAQVDELASMSRTEDFNHNKIVVKDCRANEWMWFVVRGSCEILRLVDLHKSPNYDRLIALHSYGNNRYIAEKAESRTRAKSAPGRIRTRSTVARAIRPQTCLGIRQEERGDAGSALVTQMEMPIGPDPGTQIQNLQEAVRQVMTGKYPRNKADEGDVQSGIYVRVDTLRDGQCFGLDALFEDLHDGEDEPNFSLVSKDCTVIHFPRTKFKEMANVHNLKMVRELLKTYPTDEELCERFLSKSEWDNYKHGIVESVIADVQNNVTFENSLRNCQQSGYNVRFDMDRMTQQFYTPVTSRAQTPHIGFTIPPEDIKHIRSNGLRSAMEHRRPRSAWKAPTTDREKLLNEEQKKYSNLKDRTRMPSAGNYGKHKVWAAKMKEYTTPRSRPPSAGLNTPAMSRPASAAPHIGRSKSPNCKLPESSAKSRPDPAIMVNKKVVVMDKPSRPHLVLAQPSRC